MFEDNGYYGAGVGVYAPGHNPQYQQRLTYFNMARQLFPFNTGTDAKSIKASDVIKAANEIEAFLTGDVA